MVFKARLKIDSVTLATLFMLGLALVITLSPIMAFLPKYLSAEKSLEEIELGYVFLYPTIVLDYLFERGEMVTPIALLHIKRIRESPEFFVINGSLLFTDRATANIGYLSYEGTTICMFHKKVKLDENPLLRSLIIVKHEVENNKSYSIDSIAIYSNLSRRTFLGRHPFGLTPHHYLGIAWVYRINIEPVNNNNSIAWILHEYAMKLVPEEQRERFASRALLVRYGDFYVSISAQTLYPYLSMLLAEEFENQCPLLRELYEVTVEYANRSISSEESIDFLSRFEEGTILYTTNRIPDDQAWLEATWHNFNALAPLPHALVVLSVVLILLRVRRR